MSDKNSNSKNDITYFIVHEKFEHGILSGRRTQYVHVFIQIVFAAMIALVGGALLALSEEARASTIELAIYALDIAEEWMLRSSLD